MAVSLERKRVPDVTVEASTPAAEALRRQMGMSGAVADSIFRDLEDDKSQ
jgi:hypothetical protein